MQIGELFVKDIGRPLNPVIKIEDKNDENDLYQEFEEYVVTRDVDGNLSDLYTSIVEVLRSPGDKDHIGVWISGDFGSGKSHFLKIASHLLQNREIKGRRAVEFFRDKPGLDPSVYSLMQAVGRRNVDTILFDIDSKAGDSKSEDDMVRIFMSVFNEAVGLSRNHQVAEFERHLIDMGNYDAFKEAFERISGKSWADQRNKPAFIQSMVSKALVESGISPSPDDAGRIARTFSEKPRITAEDLAEIVGRHCDARGSDYTLFFMVDEVGQFISGSVQKMLRLQTIVENIGIRCKGKAWVVVTSQEDVDAVVSGVSGNDFSKIQGRFTTRIRMSSSDVKEVVEKRFLLKKEGAGTELEAFYEGRSFDITNLLGMKNHSEIRLYRDAKEFAATYPFIPYQYPMLQDLLTSLRTKSASGKNLSNAARSMLRIFKVAASSQSEKDTTAVTPLHVFFDAIESELDSATKTVFDRAEENTTLNGFDILVLKTLYLVKYYDRLEKTLDNIAALMISSFDENRLGVKGRIDQSLDRLVRENFVQCNADSYMFLTNEEQEISREIRAETVDPESIYRDILDVAFSSVFNKTSGRIAGRQVNRYVGDYNNPRSGHELSVRIITGDVSGPMLPEKSADSILIKLSNGPQVENAFMDYLRTERYINKKGQGQTTGEKLVLEAKKGEIKEMKLYARSVLEKGIQDARFFVNRSEIRPVGSPERKLDQSMDALIGSVYSKLSYAPKGVSASVVETVLKGSSLESYDSVTSAAPLAFAELESFLSESNPNDLTVERVMRRFTTKPFGFDIEAVQWMLAVMFRHGRIDLFFDGRRITGEKPDLATSKNCLMRSANQERTRLIPRQAVSAERIENAKGVIESMFGKTLLPKESDVVSAANEGASERLKDLDSRLRTYLSNPRYPGKEVLEDVKGYYNRLATACSPEIFDYIEENEEVLRGINQRLKTVYDFLEPTSGGRRIFDRALRTMEGCRMIETYLDQTARDDIASIEGIISSGDMSRIPGLNALCSSIDDAVTEATESVRASKAERVEGVRASARSAFLDHPELLKEFDSMIEKTLCDIADERSLLRIVTTEDGVGTKVAALKRRIPAPTPPSGGSGATVPKSEPLPAVAMAASVSEIRTEEDIDAVLEELRTRMKTRLADGPFTIRW